MATPAWCWSGSRAWRVLAFSRLHALATPGVLLDHRSVGFVIATPVGLIIAAGFAAASSIDFDEGAGATVMRHQRGHDWGWPRCSSGGL